MVQTTEKQPRAARLVAKGPAGHGSRPLRTNAILHLSRAVEKVAMWDPPMRFNDTTRILLREARDISAPGAMRRATRDCSIREGAGDPRVSRGERAVHLLHAATSISPNMIQAGYQINVIPSEAEATLDIRALPDENMHAFFGLMRKVINDPSVEVVTEDSGTAAGRGAVADRFGGYHAVEAAYQKVYGVTTLPMMSTGATDMAFLRAKGMQCYGVGAMVDEEDAAKGFGAHSDQERILEESVYKHGPVLLGCRGANRRKIIRNTAAYSRTIRFTTLGRVHTEIALLGLFLNGAGGILDATRISNPSSRKGDFPLENHHAQSRCNSSDPFGRPVHDWPGTTRTLQSPRHCNSGEAGHVE